MVTDGFTWATRIAKLTPGVMVRVEVVRTIKVPPGHFPGVGNLLP